ncbi:hypothetical protein NMYAN_10291 [Nitrosomonas nitrosa]|uniref:Uncharacterized protein n=1 Tax=Nitrosomonas nitrosa TaxID=52442 RepID=A0A8H9DA02_9PROT|nr:hypothetical protein NMYAN_10291 [Nitrosomonas nitrosa]
MPLQLLLLLIAIKIFLEELDEIR